MTPPDPSAVPVRILKFADEDQAIAEIQRLRRGYRKTKNWTLPMICWHVGGLADPIMTPPPSTTPTPEEAARKKGFLDVILETGRPPGNFEAPPDATPKPDCPEDEVDRYIVALKKLKSYPHSHVNFGPFGPVSVGEFRTLMLMHTAHHLAFLEPTKPARREVLRFQSEDDVVAEVNRLRRGYAQGGSWSLPQTCSHLTKAVHARMQPGPFPPDTDEQKARRPIADKTLATGKLPDGLQAPEAFLPPANCSDAEIDALIAALQKLKAYREPISPHRLFGKLPDADARKLNLIHCAHHLSYLTPTNA
jgi:hypothetical protein